jgi:hypothetical protein
MLEDIVGLRLVNRRGGSAGCKIKYIHDFAPHAPVMSRSISTLSITMTFIPFAISSLVGKSFCFLCFHFCSSLLNCTVLPTSVACFELYLPRCKQEVAVQIGDTIFGLHTHSTTVELHDEE